MRNGHSTYAALERRIRELGGEIFERAASACPRWSQREWWLEQTTRMVDSDPRLKAAVFQFVDCLPSLKTDQQIARHLHEYIEARRAPVPLPARWALRQARSGGPLAELIGFGARLGARAMAGRFITGHDQATVLQTLERLRREGMAFTLDVLGESTTSDARADAYASVYLDCLEKLAPEIARWPGVALLDDTDFGPQPRLNISVKLTGLDPHFDAIAPRASMDRVTARLRPLLRRARERGAFVNIDIESFKHRLLTLDLFESLMSEAEFRDFADVGIVVQAYLKQGEEDLARLLEWGRRRGTRFAIRLVKGAYWDSEVAAAVRNHSTPPVWTRKWESDACYERMAKTMLQHRDLIRPCFASHNVRTIAAVMAWAEHLGVPASGYEAQMLYGMGDPLKVAVARMGRCVRVYSPYGDMLPGMAYLIRRLLENTSNDSFLKQGFAERSMYSRRLADPAAARPASSPLSKLRYCDPASDPLEPVHVFRHCPKLSFAVEENRSRFAEAIAHAAAAKPEDCPVIAAGRVLDAREKRDCVNPARTDQVRAHVHCASIAEADVAAAALARGFEFWKSTDVGDRCGRVQRAAELLAQRRFAVAAELVLSAGMTWREADAEVAEAADYMRFHAEKMLLRAHRPRRRGVPGEDNAQQPAPRGVCAVFTDGGSPLGSLAAAVSAALVCGNPVLVVPPVQTAPLAAMLMKLLTEAGVPAGTTGLLPILDDSVALHLARHSDVRLVVCQGSNSGCSTLRAAAAEARPGQRHARGFIGQGCAGGVIIVDDDADVDAALSGVLQSALTFAGQRRDGASHVIVVGELLKSFTPRLSEAVRSWIVGDPSDPATQVGPVMTSQACAELTAWIDRAEKAGRLRCRHSAPAGGVGHFVDLAVVEGNAESFVADLDGVKGPVLVLYGADDFEGAVALAHRAAPLHVVGVFSRSPSHVEQASHELDADAIFINRPTVGGEVDRHPAGDSRHGASSRAMGSGDFLAEFSRPRTLSEYTLRHGFSPQQDEAAHTEQSPGLQHA